MSTPVAPRLCAGTRYYLTAGISAVMINNIATTPPAKIRIPGVIRLLSKAYLTKKTTPRKKAKPPIHANNFTPRMDSQLIEGTNAGSETVGGGEGVVGGWRNAGSGGGTMRFADSRFAIGVSLRLSSSITRRRNSSTLT